MQRKRAGQAVIDALLAEQVEMVFGLLGSHIHAISDALLDAKSIRFVSVKHENNAALMADMYGRLTQRPGVCLVTAGPGATNSVTGVAQAYAAASPLIHITGTVPRHSKKGVFHGLDDPEFLHKTFSDVTKWSTSVDKVQDIPKTLARAFSVATSGRPGPVHVDVALDLLEAGPAKIGSYEREPSERMLPDARLVDEVTGVLLNAQSPVICAGKGIRASSASAELAALAETLAAPVVFPYDADGVLPPTHPLCAGAFYDFMPSALPLQLIEEADVLLVIGMRAGTSSAEMLFANASASLVFLSLDEEAGYARQPSMSAVVDCKATLKELVARVGAGKKRSDKEIKRRIAEDRDAIRRGLDEEVESYRGRRPMHFGLALKELVSMLDQDAVIVRDVGTHGEWTSKWVEFHGAQTLISPGSYGAMGFALPGAIAARLLHPGKQVVGITGDGAFLMSCSDFGTALEVGAKVILVILNDSRYGMIHKLQMRDFGRSFANELRSPDFAKFAESFGAVGIRVEDDSQLRDAFQRALSTDSPVIVDVANAPAASTTGVRLSRLDLGFPLAVG
jgi:acetolactate synthase-1/2/3 large subunit